MARVHDDLNKNRYHKFDSVFVRFVLVIKMGMCVSRINLFCLLKEEKHGWPAGELSGPKILFLTE